MIRPVPDAHEDRDVRPGGLVPFVVAAAFSSTAYIGTFTAATLAAREITGSAEFAGLPSALGTVGTAIAIAVLSTLMSRRGRRAGLIAGYGLAVAGAVISLVAVAAGAFPLLLAASVAIGFGNAALQLSRYAAADLVVPGRRARAVGIVVWGNTVGAVLGPNLLQPAGSLAESLGRPAIEGGMAVPVIAFSLALLVTTLGVRRPPAVLAPTGGEAAIAAAARTPWLHLVRATRVRVALIGMVSGQLVMVLLMTMTPVHVHDLGHGLATVGLVISAHTLGMFALSPLSARLVLRFGPVPVLLSGFGVLLLAAILAAIARETEIPVLTLGLFLLGYGWNLGFVAGSSLLAEGASLADRIRLQGLTDVLVWSVSAVASIASGILLDRAGYPALAVVSGAMLTLPLIAIVLVVRLRPLEPLEPSREAAREPAAQEPAA
jgi:MFS family permease